jgi:hypothetical protein
MTSVSALRPLGESFDEAVTMLGCNVEGEADNPRALAWSPVAPGVELSCPGEDQEAVRRSDS